MPEENEENIRGIVRLAGRDLKGTRRIQAALSKLKGIGSSMSKAIVHSVEIEGTKKVGKLTDEEIKRLEKVLENPLEYGIPKYMLNRRKDFETGEDLHLF